MCGWGVVGRQEGVTVESRGSVPGKRRKKREEDGDLMVVPQWKCRNNTVICGLSRGLVGTIDTRYAGATS